MTPKTIEWKGHCVTLLDQRRLPTEVCFLDCGDASSVADAIRTMAVRGAPAIGVAAAMAIALAAKQEKSSCTESFLASMSRVCREMRETRPTAVNLFWAVDRMKRVLDGLEACGLEATRLALEEEALRIYEEDLDVNRKIGENGKDLIQNGQGILTHCNAGGLATAGYGTALGVIRAAWAEGKRFRVFADETRPLLQGARLTAWELSQEKISVTLLTDNMAGWMMKKGEISLVLVGADRIARNGDTANKIGTYSLAVLSNFHKIPFYVAAPLSTVDVSLGSGSEIPIEERAGEEVTHLAGKRIAPVGVEAVNPAFDVTPHRLISGIITEKKVFRKPYARELRKLAG